MGLGHERRQAGDLGGAKAAALFVRRVGGSLGLFQAPRPATGDLADELIRVLVELRGELRKAR